jgi:hypothetical protein
MCVGSKIATAQVVEHGGTAIITSLSPVFGTEGFMLAPALKIKR